MCILSVRHMYPTRGPAYQACQRFSICNYKEYIRGNVLKRRTLRSISQKLSQKGMKKVIVSSHAWPLFGELLKDFRMRRHLTQQQLAEEMGMHRHAIGRWEQGDGLPAKKTVVLELARYLRLDDAEARQLLDASFTALAPPFALPSPRNPLFTGREDLLDLLHQHLSLEQGDALTRSYALSGLGGMGKTHLALEYAYRSGL